MLGQERVYAQSGVRVCRLIRAGGHDQTFMDQPLSSAFTLPFVIAVLISHTWNTRYHSNPKLINKLNSTNAAVQAWQH